MNVEVRRVYDEPPSRPRLLDDPSMRRALLADRERALELLDPGDGPKRIEADRKRARALEEATHLVLVKDAKADVARAARAGALNADEVRVFEWGAEHCPEITSTELQRRMTEHEAHGAQFKASFGQDPL